MIRRRAFKFSPPPCSPGPLLWWGLLVPLLFYLLPSGLAIIVLGLHLPHNTPQVQQIGVLCVKSSVKGELGEVHALADDEQTESLRDREHRLLAEPLTHR